MLVALLSKNLVIQNGSPIQVHTRPFEISKVNSKFDINLKLNLLNFENHGQLEDHGLP